MSKWYKQPGIKAWCRRQDKRWVDKLAGYGTEFRGCSTTYHKSGRTSIGYIGSTSKLKVCWYNVILFIRWLNRRF